MNAFDINKIVRSNILKLKPYASARDEFKGGAEVFLDANENPFGSLNRYPDPKQSSLKKRLSEIKDIPTNQIFLGNGSDEVIDLAFRIFCEPGKDKALTFSPSYGMYNVSAEINDVELIELPLNQSFEIDTEDLKTYLKEERLKLIFVCSPNNPTGNTFQRSTIEYILKNFKGIVLIDEAYIDFSLTASYMQELKNYPNLIISQTFSKAWGLAGARVGVAYSSKAIIDLYTKVKPPYNISSLNQEEVLKKLENIAQFEIEKNIILNEKNKLINQLSGIELVKKIHPSMANFLLVEVDNANEVYIKLVEEHIIIRNRNSVVRNCLRITIGSEQENKKLIKALEKINSELITEKL